MEAVDRDRWSGRREREAIYLFVLAHLRREVKRGTVLSDIRQIRIEMPVQQIDAKKQKKISGRKGQPKKNPVLFFGSRRYWSSSLHDLESGASRSGRTARASSGDMQWKQT